MGYFSEKLIDAPNTDNSYHGFEDQLLWRYEDLKDRYLELLEMDAPRIGDDFFTANDYRYAPIDCFNTIRDVRCAMEIAKEDLKIECGITVDEDTDVENDEESSDPDQISMFGIVLLPTWFQTAKAA